MPIEVVEVIEFPIQPPEVNIAASDLSALQQGIASHPDLQTYNRYENAIQTHEVNVEQLHRAIERIDGRMEELDGKNGNDGALEDARREVADVADATLNPHWVIKTPHDGEVGTITDVVRIEKETLQRDLEANRQELTTIEEEIKSQQALMSHYQDLLEKTGQEIQALQEGKASPHEIHAKNVEKSEYELYANAANYDRSVLERMRTDTLQERSDLLATKAHISKLEEQLKEPVKHYYQLVKERQVLVRERNGKTTDVAHVQDRIRQLEGALDRERTRLETEQPDATRLLEARDRLNDLPTFCEKLEQVLAEEQHLKLQEIELNRMLSVAKSQRNELIYKIEDLDHLIASNAASDKIEETVKGIEDLVSGLKENFDPYKGAYETDVEETLADLGETILDWYRFGAVDVGELQAQLRQLSTHIRHMEQEQSHLRAESQNTSLEAKNLMNQLHGTTHMVRDTLKDVTREVRSLHRAQQAMIILQILNECGEHIIALQRAYDERDERVVTTSLEGLKSLLVAFSKFH